MCNSIFNETLRDTQNVKIGILCFVIKVNIILSTFFENINNLTERPTFIYGFTVGGPDTMITDDHENAAFTVSTSMLALVIII